MPTYSTTDIADAAAPAKPQTYSVSDIAAEASPISSSLPDPATVDALTTYHARVIAEIATRPPSYTPPSVPAAPLPQALRTRENSPQLGAEADAGPQPFGRTPAEARQKGFEAALNLDPTGIVPGTAHAVEGAYQTATGSDMRERAAGVHKTIGGAMEAATTLLPGQLAKAPLKTAASLAAGMGLQAAAEKGSQKLGMPTEYAAVLGDLAGIFAGAATHELSPRAVEAIKTKYEPILKARAEKANAPAAPTYSSTGTKTYRPEDIADANPQKPAPQEPAAAEPARPAAAQPGAAVGARPGGGAVGSAEVDAGTGEAAKAEVRLDAKLPAELAKAKPRYAYGPKQFQLSFENDLDRAAYITAQKTPSKADAQYLKFAMDATGESEAAIRQHGAAVRAAIKEQAKDSPTKDEEGKPVVLNVADMAGARFGKAQPGAVRTSGALPELPVSAAPVKEGQNSGEYFRGDWNVPLNETGRAQVRDRAAATAGQFDRIVTGTKDRHAESAAIYAEANPQAPPPEQSPAFDPMHMGEHEGERVTPERLEAVNDHIANRFDEPIRGTGKFSGSPGESPGEWSRRLIGAVQQEVSGWTPGKKTLVVTSGRDVQAVRAWAAKGMPADRSLDTSVLTQPWKTEPGEMARLDPRTGQIENTTNADKDGIYLARHGETDANANAAVPADVQSREGTEPANGRRPQVQPLPGGTGGQNAEVPRAAPSGPRPGTGEGPRRGTGEGTDILVPGERITIPARYDVRELADIQPSHIGETFAPNDRYQLHNERDYSKPENQQRVIENSSEERFDPRYHITDNPDMTNGLTGKAGTGIVNRLIAEGFFNEQERPALMDSKTGALTQSAKDRISKALLGQFFRDSDQIARTPAAIKNKLERIAAPLAKVAGDPEWDITPEVRESIDLIEYANAHGIRNLGDVVAQTGMFGEGQQWSDGAVKLAEMLRDGKPNDVVSAFRKYVNSKEPTMFGESTPAEAFQEAFGATKPERAVEPAAAPAVAPAVAADDKANDIPADKTGDTGPTYMGTGFGALEPLFREAKAEGDRLRAARNEALAAAKAAEAKPEQMKAGEKIRAYLTSERDLWAARTNQAIDVVTRLVLPKIKDREALGIAREFRHHPLELAAFIDGTHPFLQEVDGGPAVWEKNLAKLMPVLREAQRILVKPTARERAADAAFTNIAERDLQEGRAGGWLESRWLSDEYLPHALNPAGEGEVAKLPSTEGRAMGKVGKYFGFGERRSDRYPTMVHAVADGIIPKTLDPSALFIVHADQFARARVLSNAR